jgi:hypothetical protein
MPSVTDLQQQSSSKISSNNPGKSTPSIQQINSATTDSTNVDPITQAILMLEKKQRNLGKRKVRFFFISNKYLFEIYSRKNLKVMNKKQKVAKICIKIKRLDFRLK